MISDNKTMTVDDEIKIREIYTSAYKIPTATPEADGTLKWNDTTLVVVEIAAGGKNGIGYTYADVSTAFLIDRTLKHLVEGRNLLDIQLLNSELIKHIRNNGTCGIAMMAISAIDNALWDLKAKIFEQPLYNLLGKTRDKILLYGSGGFTNYTDRELKNQFAKWEESGIRYFKMKVGADAGKDVERVRTAASILPKEAKLFVDANGAYTVKQSLEKAKQFSHYNVTWLEEPVPSHNLRGLHFIKEHAPLSINIAAGEYGYNLSYFESMLSAGAVDILQADATRCGGISGFLKAGHLCEAKEIPFSSHCAPSIHLHAALSLPSFFIAEYFFDHVRIEEMLFENFYSVKEGYMEPDPGIPGAGFEFRHTDAEKFRI